MRLHGYCTRCHHFRVVTVTRPFMFGATAVPEGICADCQEREEQR